MCSISKERIIAESTIVSLAACIHYNEMGIKNGGTVIIWLNCHDRIGRGLNPRPSANESNALPQSYLD